MVIGNGTPDVFLYSVDQNDGSMKLLTHFSVRSPHASSAWSFRSQPAIVGARMYLYGFVQVRKFTYFGPLHEQLVSNCLQIA